ncbi:MAG: RsmB/NOP family class I SAM-dependent RNA methyltransferase [Pseudomonadota bacterium]|nr:RsmB/NOP family class I SAM-dependent RNA methyltransferase [Pseudomonadota bacterium]
MTLRANQLAGLAQAIGMLGTLHAPADAQLHRFFRDHPQMGQQDRAFVAEGAFAWLRRRRSLQTLANTAATGRLALAVAVRELGHSVRELEALISTADVAWLRDFKGRLATPLPDAVVYDLPDWLWERMVEAYGEEEARALARSLAQAAPLDIRVNPLRSTREAAQSALAESGIDAALTPYSPLALRLSGRPALNRHPSFIAGAFEVQDEASQLVGWLVAPKRNDMVVDFCAGSGGKSLLLGALMRSQGRVYAFDVSEKRLANLKPRLARSGLSNVHPQLIAHERDTRVKRLAGKIDRVLVDAPCTGFGTLRRNPDLKWRQTPHGVAELAVKQAAILRAASGLVKPGGRLVYATCSILPDENERIVEAFVAERAEFSVTSASDELARAGIALDTGAMLRVYPHRHGCDGFFAAVLTRAA